MCLELENMFFFPLFDISKDGIREGKITLICQSRGIRNYGYRSPALPEANVS